MYDVCMRNDWGDPFSYARSREIHMAITMKHIVAATYSGSDATDQDGGAEYKSTIQKTISGTYNGISVQPTWEEQEKYLVEQKIGVYPNHYFARFEGGSIVELWKLKCEDVLAILLPKLKKQYLSHQVKQPKDPRLGATVSKTDIYKYGRNLIG